MPSINDDQDMLVPLGADEPPKLRMSVGLRFVALDPFFFLEEGSVCALLEFCPMWLVRFNCLAGAA